MLFPTCPCATQCSSQEQRNFKTSRQVPTPTSRHDLAERSTMTDLKNITVSIYSFSKFEQAAVETDRADLFPYLRAKEIQKCARNFLQTPKVCS